MTLFTPGGEFGIGAKGGAALPERLAVQSAAKTLQRAEPVASAMKDDIFHRGATWLRDEAAQKGTHFAIKQGDGKQATLTQMEATINGIKGVVEYIVDEKGNLTHQIFKPGEVVNGKPN